MDPPHRGKKLIIAIDGPAASGKSTVGKMLAARLGYLYIDTGAIYRAVAWLAARRGLTEEEPGKLAEMIGLSEIRLEDDRGRQRVLANGSDITENIRTEEVGHLASKLSALPEVRRALLDIQRRLGAHGGIVMDGRDIGTVIFPHADLKFFLTAGGEERGRRRWRELKDRGIAAKLESVRDDLSRRDSRDESRAHAPLRPAPDAVLIDSTGLSPEEVLACAMKTVRARAAGSWGAAGPPSCPP